MNQGTGSQLQGKSSNDVRLCIKKNMNGMRAIANALAKALDVPTNRITAILNEQRGVTADTALRLANFLAPAPTSG